MRCAVIGGGAWGSALAHLLAQGGHETCLWAREADVAAHLNLSHANPRFLPGATLDARIHATTDMAEALGGAQLVLYVCLLYTSTSSSPRTPSTPPSGRSRRWPSS